MLYQTFFNQVCISQKRFLVQFLLSPDEESNYEGFIFGMDIIYLVLWIPYTKKRIELQSCCVTKNVGDIIITPEERLRRTTQPALFLLKPIDPKI